MGDRRRRLVEVAFPLEEVSAHSRHDKYLRHGHISTLHIWWARRPLPACRAFIYASLVDDPDTEQERDELLKEVADLASWDAIRKPDQVVRPREKGGSGLTGHHLLERARQRILECNGGKPPRLLDPFAGGGAIPLEALRLGCEVEASDLNPVAVLILKGTVEYPQKYGRPLAEQVEQKRRGERDSIAGVNGDVPPYVRDAAGSRQVSFTDGDLVEAYRKNPLATDVRYWGNWMLDRAREELADFYPPDPDSSVPVAYLWSRTVLCPNCGAHMPLLRQYWLVNRDKRKVALEPNLDHEKRQVSFEVVEGPSVKGNPAKATTSGGDTVCLLCRQVVKADYVREAGRNGRLNEAMTAVVLQAHGGGGKRYRPATESDQLAFRMAHEALAQMEEVYDGDLALIPDEPIAPETLGLRIDAMGFERWGELFNSRQLLALTIFSRSVRQAHAEMISCGLDEHYATAVATYLGLTVDRLAVRGSNQCIYNAKGEKIENEIARGALPPVWDYAEAVSVRDSSGSWPNCLEGISLVIEATSIPVTPALVRQEDASQGHFSSTDAIVTDPPYYAAVDYAGLSDFFYVWLKRSIGFLHPDLLALPLTPKKRQAIMASESRDIQARQRYVQLMQEAFECLRPALNDNEVLGVVFANTNPDAWATLIEGLLAAQMVPDASWPIDTEMQSGMVKLGQARLKTSVWMACRTRHPDARDAFVGDVMEEMRPVIREKLLYFWGKGIRGADFFISAIGPALSVFGRHNRILRPDGTEVGVRDFLDLVRKESTQVALEQVLGGADLGVVDAVTRQYVTWVWSYSRAPLDAGEAIALCLATGADYHEVVRPGSIAAEAKEKSKKVVKLRTIRERGQQEEDLGENSPARPAPLIDQLQRAAHLWGLNKADELARFRASLGETRWPALRTLGQAITGCLPDGDDDRRLINGLLGSNVMATAAPKVELRPTKAARAGAPLPGFEDADQANG